jgi:hypothetical protein
MNIGILGYGEIGRSIHWVYENSIFDFQVKVKDLDRDDGLDDIDVLNVAIPFNQSFDFVQTVVDAASVSSCRLVIIHSTVSVGTTKKIKAALPDVAVCHSPCRGVHPNLFEGLMTFVKLVGATCKEDSMEASKHLEMLGIKTHICKNSETSELAKLLDTSYYGVCIAYHGEAMRACKAFDADFEDAMTLYNKTYNEGYTLLRKNNVIRPVLTPPDAGIGGHCVVENAELLKSQFESKALDLITSYRKNENMTMMENDLFEIGKKYGTDKVTHFYLHHYDKLLSPSRHSKLKLLEIGIYKGSSIRMWREYFPNAEIHCVDINRIDLSDMMNTHQHTVDCDNKEALKNLASQVGDFDIIIDDGGHTMRQQQNALDVFWPSLKPGGIFIMEDIHTSFKHLYNHCNSENQPTTYDLLESLRRGESFESKYIDLKSYEEIMRTVNRVEIIWSKRILTNDAKKPENASITSFLTKK